MTAIILDSHSYDDSDEERSHPPSMQFTFALGDNIFSELYPEQGNKSWGVLASACENGTLQRKDWNMFNGDCSFMVRDGKLIVDVTRSGNGEGGTLQLILDAAPAATGFRRAAELTRAYLAREL